jgi:RimJ/RimL family protein N-acetyltransferase
VAANCGAKFEGLMRDKLTLNGESHSALMYSLIAEDVR